MDIGPLIVSARDQRERADAAENELAKDIVLVIDLHRGYVNCICTAVADDDTGGIEEGETVLDTNNERRYVKYEAIETCSQAWVDSLLNGLPKLD